MRPTVYDLCRQFDRQTRAYAEYRVFFGLTTASAASTTVSVILGREPGNAASGGQNAVCAIQLTTFKGETLEVSATGHHPYPAIDRATKLMQAKLQDHCSDRRGKHRRRSAAETAAAIGPARLPPT